MADKKRAVTFCEFDRNVAVFFSFSGVSFHVVWEGIVDVDMNEKKTFCLLSKEEIVSFKVMSISK